MIKWNRYLNENAVNGFLFKLIGSLAMISLLVFLVIGLLVKDNTFLMIVGILELASMGLILAGIIETKKSKARVTQINEIIKHNHLVSGYVVEYKEYHRINLGRASPALITYTYKYYGHSYNEISNYLWEKPRPQFNEDIRVYISADGKDSYFDFEDWQHDQKSEVID